MSRRKQKRPVRGGAEADAAPPLDVSEQQTEAELAQARTPKRRRRASASDIPSQAPRLIWASQGPKDGCIAIAEISLAQVQSYEGEEAWEPQPQPRGCCLSVRFTIVGQGAVKIGGYEDLSTCQLLAQIVRDPVSGCDPQVLLTGALDGPDSAVSALLHLVRTEFVRLEAPPEAPGRVRVLVTGKALRELGERGRAKANHRALQCLVSWLRPDLGPAGRGDGKAVAGEGEGELGLGKDRSFDPAALFDAIKPCGNEKGLDVQPPELLAELRPYQRRAAYWMVQRELGPDLEDSDAGAGAEGSSAEDGRVPGCPLWFSGRAVDGSSRFYYNPYSGCISRGPQNHCTYVHGGILADEMGLGKTVEVLACILANKNGDRKVEAAKVSERKLRAALKKRKVDRIECACGALDDSSSRDGCWVQCDLCDAWQHSSCVGFSPSGPAVDQSSPIVRSSPEKSVKVDRRSSREVQGDGLQSSAPAGRRKSARKKPVPDEDTPVQLTSGDFVCGICSEMIGSSFVDGECGATLIVCPTPILQQWHDEILRHTKEGAVRVLVYEGVQRGGFLWNCKESSPGEPAEAIKIVAAYHLAASDIVLTTYDTLRSDLSHDLDQADRNKSRLRLQKRYRVIPTPLTRLKWRRICLDEAQMVESDTARAAEMALRLDAEYRWCVSGTPLQRGLDDLYGLLKFLRAEPLDDHFWWTHAIKRPFEEGCSEAAAFLYTFMHGLMWRSSKEQVMDEIGLPSQEHQLTWLNLSPIESHFYKQQHEKCALKAREVLVKHQKMRGIEDATRSMPEGPAGSNLAGEEDQGNLDLVPTVHDSRPGLSMTVKQEPFMERLVNQSQVAKLLKKLLRLRQACCHPQVGKSGIRPIQQSPMTMDEILQVLIDKAKVEGEESQRNLLAALNGLAGLAFMEGNRVLAVSIYREALSEGEHAESFRVDPLQKLHTLHNLADVLRESDVAAQKGPDVIGSPTHCDVVSGCNGLGSLQVVPRTLRDSKLDAEIEEIKVKYMSPFNLKLIMARQELDISQKEVQEAQQICEASGAYTWWLDVMLDPRKSAELISKIRDHLLSDLGHHRYRNASSLALRFEDLSGLKYVLQVELDAIHNGRSESLKKLIELDKRVDNPSAFDIKRAGSCSRCQVNSSDTLCIHCEMLQEFFQAYEAHLFQINTQASDAGVVLAEAAVVAQNRALADKRWDPANLSGETAEFGRTKRAEAARVVVSRSPSETEQILQMMKSYAKDLGSGNGPALAEKHLNLLKAMRREYGKATALADCQRQVLVALDELNMAITRYTQRVPGDEESADKLHPEEVPAKNAQLTGDKFTALHGLSRARGQHRYLKGLALARSQATVAATAGEQVVGKKVMEEDPCPVCQEKLGDQLMVLPCGHLFCCKCVMLLADRVPPPAGGSPMKRLHCPSCRAPTVFGDIALVDSRKNGLEIHSDSLQGGEADGDRSVEVKGSFGTKMEAVVRRILWLKLIDPNCKVLVFSTWHEVLDLLEHVLVANAVTFARVKPGRRLDAAIKKFKGHEPVQVLLLPIHLGANGLNLIEAQHVILLEPLLNPGVEAQAINRVHRIGQRQKTYVHRFIVRNTVEESIYSLGRSKEEMGHSVRATRGQKAALTVGDVQALFSQDVQITSDTPIAGGEEMRALAALAAEARRDQSLVFTGQGLQL